MGERFDTGDRVVFLRGHPWHGREGTVRELMRTSIDEGWSVEVDGGAGLRSFATSEELRMITRTTEGD